MKNNKTNLEKFYELVDWDDKSGEERARYRIKNRKRIRFKNKIILYKLIFFDFLSEILLKLKRFFYICITLIKRD